MLRGGVDFVDRVAEDLVGPLRGHRGADAAAYTLSALGDHGLIWFVVGVVRGRRPGPRRARAVRAVVFTGVVSPLVNAGLKSAVGRLRPAQVEPHPLPVRTPRTSSFPSGHALAAWCAATLFAEGDHLAPWYYGLAAAVAASRVHVRLHHASDVLAGSVLGAALGGLGRLLVPVDGTLMKRLECVGLRGG
jgi:undecaprenyl-diphosphatase